MNLGQTTPTMDALYGRGLAGLTVIFAAAGAWLLAFKLKSQPLFIDFLTMWTGGHMAGSNPAGLYDVASINRAQEWLLGPGVHDRPFPYPPPTLLAFGPLGHLPFWPASAVWMILTGGAFAWAVLRLMPERRLAGGLLVLVLPGTVWAALSGQCDFLLGALGVAGVARLETRPLVSGALLGVAAAFKPSVLVLLPVALLAGGHWRAIAGAAMGGLTVLALSVAAYGAPLWLAWIAMSPGYLARITSFHQYNTSIIAPLGIAVQLGWPPGATLAWRAAFTLIGIAVAALVFRRTRALAPRLTALFGASLLASPYAMNYETTLLAPGAVLAVIVARGMGQRLRALAAYVILAVAGLPVVSAAALMAFLAVSLSPWLGWTRPSETAAG